MNIRTIMVLVNNSHGASQIRVQIRDRTRIQYGCILEPSRSGPWYRPYARLSTVCSFPGPDQPVSQEWFGDLGIFFWQSCPRRQ